MKFNPHTHIATRQNISPQSIATTTVNGATQDRRGFENAMGVLHTPASITTSVLLKLQEGDLANGSDMADIAGATTGALAAGGGLSQRVIDTREIYKRFIRCVITTGGTNICGADLEFFPAQTIPVTAEGTDVVVTD